ncbi:hypothetical protein TVAGG3_0289050 [Trichomonas vaginalis G3]|uniref:hypothetical protein n=1 Tax=Trichomonas vaginalis (strain ATCC PRA-98 / G3) TaxID=412133 RepID=UPI0021E573EE|nr:hypothetical protein TVAGG3_0289050 [Trichomonas vaginalis G3]KAI5527116.1 hypothetical protein TVAGG3_0289050 [Trichomonas vaginalis G3]
MSKKKIPFSKLKKVFDSLKEIKEINDEYYSDDQSYKPSNNYLKNLALFKDILDKEYTGKANKKDILNFLGGTNENEIETANPHVDINDTEAEIEELMNIPTAQIPLKKYHDERFQDFVQEVSQNLLNGEFDESLSKEGTEFVKRHKLQFMDSNLDCIELFHPLDEVDFKKVLESNHYKKNSKNIEDKGLYTLYYLNNVSDVKQILDYLDDIATKTKGTYKILCDFGFVTEDSVTKQYSLTPPKEDEVERSIPFTISNIKDMNSYKHYVYANISEKMEQTHMSSRMKYCAITFFR